MSQQVLIYPLCLLIYMKNKRYNARWCNSIIYKRIFYVLWLKLGSALLTGVIYIQFPALAYDIFHIFCMSTGFKIWTRTLSRITKKKKKKKKSYVVQDSPTYSIVSWSNFDHVTLYWYDLCDSHYKDKRKTEELKKKNLALRYGNSDIKIREKGQGRTLKYRKEVIRVNGRTVTDFVLWKCGTLCSAPAASALHWLQAAVSNSARGPQHWQLAAERSRACTVLVLGT
jgi:hypothetical protein